MILLPFMSILVPQTIFLTSATPVTSSVDNRKTKQINQRVKIFQFQSTIEHREEQYKEHTRIYHAERTIALNDSW